MARLPLPVFPIRYWHFGNAVTTQTASLRVDLRAGLRDLAERFTRLCPGVTILVSSREVLRIAGEAVYRVPPLEVPPPGQAMPDNILGHSAVELFITRPSALGTAFSPQGEELISIAAICRRLDGIPLAIEFAAAGAATLGIASVAIGLRDRFAPLTRGRRTALPRHRTLRFAHEQGALFWELRIALSLARLRVSQGRPQEARTLLAPVYDRCTEGFATVDLRAARAMLDALPS